MDTAATSSVEVKEGDSSSGGGENADKPTSTGAADTDTEPATTTDTASAIDAATSSSSEIETTSFEVTITDDEGKLQENVMEVPEEVIESAGETVEESSSIIEMEIEDSNTGDTITSNPEIDSGSAAAAATALIVDDKQVEDEGEEAGIVIVSTQSIAPTSSSPGESGTTSSEAATVTTEDAAKSSPSITIEEKTLKTEGEELAEQTENLLLAEDADEPMDTSESSEQFIPSAKEENEISEPVAVVLESISAADMEQNLLMEPQTETLRPNANFTTTQERPFLHEEDSMTSLPDDATEIDKENNGVDRDLILGDEDNEDDDETYLEITRRRISQDREGNCYCGKDRNFNIPELLCASCYRWFHESCISYQLGKLVPFTTNYVFTCKNCSPTGLECFRRNQAQFSQMCETVLANLTQASVKDGTNLKMFSKDKDIIPFFEIHWEALTTNTRRVTQSWHSTVIKTLTKESGVLYSCKEVPGDEGSPYFGLLSDDLTQIHPNYEAMIKAGQLKITDSRNCSSSMRGRGAKRRSVTDQSNVVQNMNKKPRGDNFGPKPSVGHGYPSDHPFNKDSYRYILAEPDPNAPFRQEFDESNEWSGKPIHGWLCRVVNPPSVLLALHDRAPQLKVSEDRLSVTGDKGYCMIRATHGVSRGSWYFEAKITDMPEGSATRLGFSQQFGNLQGPLGFDRFGYSWRSRYGTTFHEARGKSYAKGGYGLDDVLGFLIILPENPNLPTVPASIKDRPLVKFKSHLYYEDKDDPKELNRRDLRKGSKILCFKNGVCQGIAFQDIFCGTYYPAISLYKSVTVRLNFGPEFEAPPATEYEFKAMSDRAEDFLMEQTMADLVYLTENDGKLKLDNAVPMPL